MELSFFMEKMPKRIENEDLKELSAIGVEELPQVYEDFPKLILYKGRTGRRTFRCTSCDGLMNEEEIIHSRIRSPIEQGLLTSSHGQKAECPLCGAESRMICAGRWKGAYYNHEDYRPIVFEYIPKEQNGELVFLFCYDTARRFYEDPLGMVIHQFFDFKLEDIFVMRRGIAAQYQASMFGGGASQTCVISAEEGKMKRVGNSFSIPFARHVWSTGCYRYRIHRKIGGVSRENSILKYVPQRMIEEYDQCMTYAYSVVFPSVEMFFKMGLTRPLDHLLYGGKFYTSLYNFAGRNIKEVFPQLSRSDIKWWTEKKGDTDALFYYIQLRGLYRKDEDAYEAVTKLQNEQYELRDRNLIYMMKRNRVKPEKLYDYLKALIAGKGEKPWGKYVSTAKSYWMDYISAAEGVKLDLSRTEFTLPKKSKLKERHDVATGLWRDVIAQRQTVEMKELCERLQKIYGYDAHGLTIVIPRSTRDIIDEGKAQANCVAGYADRHKNGKLAIVFIRKKETPNVPFITVEMRKDQLWQAHRKGNTGTRQEDNIFINEWLEVVKKRFEEAEKNKRKEKTAVAVGVTA